MIPPDAKPPYPDPDPPPEPDPFAPGALERLRRQVNDVTLELAHNREQERYDYLHSLALKAWWKMRRVLEEPGLSVNERRLVRLIVAQQVFERAIGSAYQEAAQEWHAAEKADLEGRVARAMETP